MSDQILLSSIIDNGMTANKIKGVSAAILTMSIWSGYFFFLRIGILSPLSMSGLAYIRFTVPGVILLPVFMKSLKKYREVEFKYSIRIILGGGIPFFLLSLSGMRLSGITTGSTILPGTIPLFVSLIGVLFYKNKIHKSVFYGLIAITTGVTIMIIQAGFSGGIKLLVAVLLFMLSALSWAIFSVNVKKCNLKPLELIAMVAVPSGIIMNFIIVIFRPDTGLTQITFLQLLPQLITQGIVVGILAGVSYSYAISKVGPETSSAIGAATPVTATLAAMHLPGESLNTITFIGMIIIVAGVVSASGLFSKEVKC